MLVHLSIRLSVRPSLCPSVCPSVHHFLDASTHLYMRVCPSVGPSVRPSVTTFFNRESSLKELSDYSKCFLRGEQCLLLLFLLLFLLFPLPRWLGSWLRHLRLVRGARIQSGRSRSEEMRPTACRQRTELRARLLPTGP